MRKNLWLFLFLIFILVILMTRCISMQYFDIRIGETPIEIAPYPEKTIELVNIYFGDAENNYLKKEQRAIERTIESKEEVILRELIRGPKNSTFAPTVPPQTRLYSVSTVNGTCYVNLSREFIINFRGGERAEITAVYSIVNSLTEIQSIRRVQILVEGERLQQYHKYLSLREPYNRNEGIINSPFPSPIEVLETYFSHIEAKEYRRAFDQIYRPLEYNLDFSMFFYYFTRNKVDLTKLTITTFKMTKTSEGASVIIDYIEELESGRAIEHKEEEFQFVNDFGEWKIIYNQI